jgi:predicted porin
LEMRPDITGRNSNGSVNMPTGSSSGNQWVGLQNASWGTLRLGSIDQYYIDGGGYGGQYGPIDATMGNLFNNVNTSGPGVVQFADGAATRTRSVIHWDSPNWNGFTLQLGYGLGTSGSGGNNDLATNLTRGYTLYLSPRFNAGNWNVGWNYYRDFATINTLNGTGTANTTKSVWMTPAGAPAGALIVGAGGGAISQINNLATGTLGIVDATENRIYGEFMWNGFSFMAGIDHAKLDIPSGMNLGPGVGQNLATRTTYILSTKYDTGPHQFWVTYGHAGDTSGDTAVANGHDGAVGFNIGYAYLFSKRTSVGVGYGKIYNHGGGYYSLANEEPGTNNLTGSGYNVTNGGSYQGEKPSYFGMSMRHLF